MEERNLITEPENTATIRINTHGEKTKLNSNQANSYKTRQNDYKLKERSNKINKQKDEAKL